MSKLFKSKFLLGVTLVAVLVVGGMSVASEASAQQAVVSASDIQYAATVKVGSSGQAALIWQKFFNHYSSANLVADGAFGPLTSAAAKIWQASRSLAADGVMGPMSRASAVAQINAGVFNPGPGTFPAGCSSASGFSVTTGFACSGSFPAGCTSTSGFSPTTGMSCSGGSTPNTVEGGAGSLEEADFVSSLNNEEVGEGQDDVAVVGLDLMADDGSDLMIRSVRVSFEEQAAGGSSDFDDYAQSVSIWFEGEKVGEVDVEDMNEDDDIWSDTISLDEDAIIDADEEGRLEIAVSAVNNIDSSDLGSGNNDWDVIVENIRYEDADGVVQTESTLDDIGTARAFFFDSFASANDVELTVRKTSDSPKEQTVTIDEDGGDEVMLLAGEMEAEGSDITVKDLTVTITPAGTGDASEIATRYFVKIDGEEVDSVDSDECTVVGDCDGSGTATAVDYVFDMDDVEVPEGDDAIEFEIWAELDEISATFAEGDSLDSSVNADDIDAEDESGEDLGAGELSGVANGEEQTFFSEGIMVDEVEATSSTTFTADDAGEDSVGRFVVEFDVTANETEIYLDKSTDGSGTAGTNGEGVVYTVDGGTAPTVTAVLECVSGCGNSSDNTVDEFYIAEGDTETYRLTVNVTSDVTDNYAVWIESINWDSSDVAAATQFYASNLGEDSDADTGTRQLISL